MRSTVDCAPRDVNTKYVEVFNASESNGKGTKEKLLIFLTDEERQIFFAIFLVIFLIAIIGNVAAIFATAKRKHRFIQKTCMVSLAVSDLSMAIGYSINNLESLSHPLINWTMGKFMCSFVPMIQMWGITASSAAIVVIAMDRYRNVVHALTKQWNPKPWICITICLIIWSICIGLSFPIVNMFSLKTMLVVYFDETDKIPLYTKRLAFCLSFVKNELMTYYICMAILIFASLLVIFIWLYYNIATLIWRHRKPLSQRTYPKTESSMTVETSTTQTKSLEYVRPKPMIPQGKSIHVERKIRTFKIIVFLVLVFFICRAPYWVFNIIKLTDVHNEHQHWIMLYSFNALALLNSALNPFLYTFLQATLSVLAKIQRTLNDFMCKICCCCCSNTEFEEFEKENPFVVGKPIIKDVRIKKIQFEDMGKKLYRDGKSSHINKI